MTHSEKFIEIVAVYSEKFVDIESLGEKLNSKRPTSIYNWLKGTNPNAKSRSKICDIFGLKEEVWTEKVLLPKSFRTRLKNGDFNIITKAMMTHEKIDNIILDELFHIDTKESKMLEQELKEDIGATCKTNKTTIINKIFK